METFLGLIGGVWTWLWQASWQASTIILLVLLAQWLLRHQFSPRWRHALWLLVVIRLLMPWSIESPLSMFNWLQARPVASTISTKAQRALPNESSEVTADNGGAAVVPGLRKSKWLPIVWLAGALAIPSYLLLATLRLGWIVRRQRPVTNGQVLELLEDCKQQMGVRTPLSLIETSAVNCPSLFGFVRPRLLLPAGFTSSFSLPELRYVLLHELAHVKRGDIPMNWISMAPLAPHWFNPLVWFAFSRMRADGELACDALALSHTQEGEKRHYGQTIIKLLESFSRPAVAPGLVGILENKNQMKRRISMIAAYSKNNRWPIVAGSLFAALAVVTLTDAQSGQGGGSPAAQQPGGSPQIVSTSPEVGATEVDPSIKEITVTFDRDMGGGCSWTGSGPDYPSGKEGEKPRWVNKRTCALPVKLENARYYRVGINSTSYQNFKSTDGVPARPSAIYFTTKGASEELKRKATRPMIVAIAPKNGATDVDPGLTELRVTFNVPMGGGFSWTGGGPQFPTIPEGKKPFWTDDMKTCVLPVQLEPGKEYSLGLNSPSHKNFQSAGGVPLDPVRYGFKTRN